MSDRVQVGIIGTSWWTELMFLPSLESHPGAEIVAICGRDGERTGALARKHNIPKAFTAYPELLKSGIEAVVIAAPDDLHHEMTLSAIAAGLHVLCEKPMALGTGDAAEMLARANEAGIKHMVPFTWHWQPHFQHLKSLVDDKFVGRPLRAEFRFVGGSGPSADYQWRMDAARATGALGDLGSHMIHMAQWLMGPISSVMADAPVLFRREIAQPANDTAHLIVRFASGAQGIIDVTTLTHQDCACSMSVGIDGEDGSVEVEHVVLGPRDGLRFVATQRGGATETIVVPDARYGEMDRKDFMAPFTKASAGARHFIDAIQGGFRPEPGFEAGVEVQKVLDAALRSHRERRWVDV
ncbi:Gfo/Idh/MocA family oxidoreductase [Devosia sp. ZB163]|uniref:Gfo/Idh/MocA family protein n=1 Tax=Devosia sp. ZB163 TaxID=3025938 RepID=UPI00235FA0A9|nr:Gfo/Idh/MocA family oxidoreductase [Devosia sp. ZB163]MDC9823886.1 Gfo/Idh/MocA family oxidoreductase [Devosia sp. ZB163]